MTHGLKVGKSAPHDPPPEQLTPEELADLVEAFESMLRTPERSGYGGGLAMRNSRERDAAALVSLDGLKFKGER